jgi:hypothetical protein
VHPSCLLGAGGREEKGGRIARKKLQGVVLGVGGGGVWIRRRPGEKEGVPFAFYILGSATLHKHNSWVKMSQTSMGP